MSWLSRVLGYASREERLGLSLNRQAGWWEVNSFQDLPSLLRAIERFFGGDAVLYLEGTSISTDVEEFLSARKLQQRIKMQISTIWPRPKVFHLLLVPEHVLGLIALAEKHAIPEICDHLHVSKDSVVLLEGPDICDRRVNLSGELSEEQIKVFCGELHCKYEKAMPN